MTAAHERPALSEIEHPWSCPDGTLVIGASAAESEWLDKRRDLIGASDLAKMTGHSRWGDPLTVWTEKMRLLPDSPTTTAQRRGHLLEPAIVDLWREHYAEFDVDVRRHGLVRSRRAPHLGATVDRLSICNMGGRLSRCTVEVKSQVDMSEWDGDEVPVAYQLQGGAQLASTGRDHVHYVVLGPRFRIEHRVIERDAEFIAQIEATVEAWWERHIVGELAPVAGAASLSTLRNTRARGDAEACVIDDDLAPHVHALLDAQQTAVETQRVIDEATAQIMQRMGDATELRWPDGSLAATWRQGKTVDGANKDWQRAHPDLVAQFSVPSTELSVAKMIENHPELIGDGGLRYRRTFKTV